MASKGASGRERKKIDKTNSFPFLVFDFSSHFPGRDRISAQQYLKRMEEKRQREKSNFRRQSSMVKFYFSIFILSLSLARCEAFSFLHSTFTIEFKYQVELGGWNIFFIKGRLKDQKNCEGEKIEMLKIRDCALKVLFRDIGPLHTKKFSTPSLASSNYQSIYEFSTNLRVQVPAFVRLRELFAQVLLFWQTSSNS